MPLWYPSRFLFWHFIFIENMDIIILTLFHLRISRLRAIIAFFQFFKRLMCMELVQRFQICVLSKRHGQVLLLLVNGLTLPPVFKEIIQFQIDLFNLFISSLIVKCPVYPVFIVVSGQLRQFGAIVFWFDD